MLVEINKITTVYSKCPYCNWSLKYSLAKKLQQFFIVIINLLCFNVLRITTPVKKFTKYVLQKYVL